MFDDPNCFSFQEIFPGGFTPQFGGEVVDHSVVGGVRGQFPNGLLWDASVSAGASEVDFFITNTVNASLGPDTPTSFDSGLYRQQESGVNFDLAYEFSPMVHLAGGFEWRDETFGIGIGDGPSWEIGPLAAQGFSSASNGFPGCSDIAAGEWSRASVAVYGDVELDDEDGKWAVGGALRFENFEDFGTTLNGKGAARLQVHRIVALRTSLSTGFRAPTPGQQNAYNVSTVFNTTLMELENNGTVPSHSAAARLKGGKPFEAEKPVNFTVGAVVENGPLSLTADFFRVAISDRLALTSSFALTPGEVDILLSEGVTDARNLAAFQFFSNDFATRTQGLDVVATYKPVKLNGDTEFSVLYNFTDTGVTDSSGQLLSPGRIRLLQEALPRSRWSVSLRQKLGRGLRLLGRVSFFDSWFDNEDDRLYGGR